MPAESNFAVLEAEEFRGTHLGTYYGNGFVLARTPTHLLVWIRPGHVYSGQGRPWAYTPTRLKIIRRDVSDRAWTLSSGGRMANALSDAVEAIDGVFGEGFHALLEPGKTVVIGHDR